MRYMKLYLVLLATLITFSGIGQALNENNECIEKCNHAYARDNSGAQQAEYYQYSSMNKYDVKYLKLDLNAEAGSRDVSGTAFTRALVLQPMDSFITELRNNMIVDSVFINGIKLAFQHSNDHVYIPLSPSLAAGTYVTALFYYRGTTNSGAVYAGTSAGAGLTYTATLFESYQGREWFPVKQIF